MFIRNGYKIKSKGVFNKYLNDGARPACFLFWLLYVDKNVAYTFYTEYGIIRKWRAKLSKEWMVYVFSSLFKYVRKCIIHMLERVEKANKIWLLNEWWVEFAFQSFWVKKKTKKIQDF